MNTQDARAALAALRRHEESHEAEISQYSSQAREDAEHDVDRECPVFYSFYEEGGNESIKAMTNLTAAEARTFYNELHDFIHENWNVGQGRRSAHKLMDMLFMLLTCMKHGGTWHFLGNMFRIKGATFQKAITRFLNIISPFVYSKYVGNVSKEYSLSKMSTDSSTFSSFNFCLEALDVSFQQANSPSGNMEEGRVYFSGKHHLYGYKLEVAVRPNGLASDVSKHYPGSVSDISIMTERVLRHRARLTKTSEENECEGHEEYPNQWGILMDKGYQGAREVLRGMHPIQKPRNGSLTGEQEEWNKDLATDRIIIENFFGRMKSLWKIMARKYVWSEKNYDTIAYLCVGLTNLHIKTNPLRNIDGRWLNRYSNRLTTIGENRIRSRAAQQAGYRERLKIRLGTRFRQILESSEDEDDDDDDFDVPMKKRRT